MKLSEFKIGESFWMTGIEYRCTDTGTRIVAAIQLVYEDKSWYNGPPYAIQEKVLDEHDQEVCYSTPPAKNAAELVERFRDGPNLGPLPIKRR